MNRTAGIRPLWLVIGASLWMATVGNAALWGEMRALEALQGPAGWAFGAGLGLMVAACLAAIVSLLAWRWTLKPALIVLLIASATATHFMLASHVFIDSSPNFCPFEHPAKHTNFHVDGASGDSPR